MDGENGRGGAVLFGIVFASFEEIHRYALNDLAPCGTAISLCPQVTQRERQ